MDLKSINSLLYSVHLMLSVALKTPEIALTEQESEMLGDATARVARHYNIGASEKVIDWGNFAIAAATVYGSRIFLVKSRKTMERQAAQHTVM